MTGDELAVLIHARHPALFERLADRAGKDRRCIAVQQMPCERPVHQPNRMFEAARPMHAGWIRTLIEPRFEQYPATFRIFVFMREAPRLSQRHELRMPAR